MMPRKKLHKATLKGTIALYKKRKLPHPVSSAKTYMRGYVADGYYEWKREKNMKTPHYFKRQDDEAIFFAGIYKTKQFCIVTREATSNVGDIHDRQPVIINKKDLNYYLDVKNDGVDFLNSYKAPELKFHPVSKDVNIPINNNENLILPK